EPPRSRSPAGRPRRRPFLVGFRADPRHRGAPILRRRAAFNQRPGHAVTATLAPTLEPRVLAELRAIVGDRGLLTEPEDLRTYECDGLTNFRAIPRAVLLPSSTGEVQGILRVCHRERIPFVA